MRLAQLGALLPLLLVEQQSNVKATAQTSGTTARLIAVSAVSDQIVWVSGEKGTFARTTDGGATWKSAVVPGAERLDFRDIEGLSDKVAVLMSAGNGPASKIYRTTDAGATWSLVFTNPDSAGFYDCIDFFDANRGLVIGDEINGEMAILSTTDGGATWKRLPAASLPKPIAGEGSFASSGTCLLAQRTGFAWGVTTKGRVIRTNDFGKTWSVATAMKTASDSVGLSSVTFRDNLNGYVFGGYGARAGDTLVYATNDGGKTFMERTRPPNGAGIWGGVFVPNENVHILLTVGPKGSAYSSDGARGWVQIDSVNYWGVGAAPNSDIAWGVGRGGRITKFTGF